MSAPDDETDFGTDARRRVGALVASTFGAAPRRVDAIPHGLGSRRFFRVALAEDGRAGAPRTVVARVEREEDPSLRPPGVPPEPPLEPLRTVLEDAGLPVPACFATATGIALLEDVGDASVETLVAAGISDADREALYRAACALVPRLQRVAPRDDVPAFARSLDDALFRYKADQVVAWALPWAHGGDAAPGSEAAAVRDAFAWIARTCRDAPQRLAHRDFKAANLHVRPGSRAGVVMIDFQGAFLAPPEYDLVCLLRDSHVALPEPLVEKLLRDVRPTLPDAPDPEAFDRRFTLLTLTRNGKDLSRYLYAAIERGDDRYARLLPRAVDTLRRASERAAPWSPALARLADVVAAWPDPPCAR